MITEGILNGNEGRIVKNGDGQFLLLPENDGKSDEHIEELGECILRNSECSTGRWTHWDSLQ